MSGRTDTPTSDLDVRGRPGGQTGGIAIGYKTPAGETRVVPGDESFPYMKDPPALNGMQVYYASATIPTGVLSVGDYREGPRIDTDGYRQLELMLEVTLPTAAAAPTGFLSVLPQKLRTVVGEDAEVWAPLGVVDPTLLADTASTPPPIIPGYAARNVFSSELIFDPVRWGGTLDGPHLLTLTFDVQSTRAYRFLFGFRRTDPAATGGALRILYELER